MNHRYTTRQRFLKYFPTDSVHTEKAISVISYHSSYTEKTVLSPILVIVLKHKHFQNKYTQNKEEA